MSMNNAPGSVQSTSRQLKRRKKRKKKYWFIHSVAKAGQQFPSSVATQPEQGPGGEDSPIDTPS